MILQSIENEFARLYATYCNDHNYAGANAISVALDRVRAEFKKAGVEAVEGLILNRMPPISEEKALDHIYRTEEQHVASMNVL